jgi:hypothetical protein
VGGGGSGNPRKARTPVSGRTGGGVRDAPHHDEGRGRRGESFCFAGTFFSEFKGRGGSALEEARNLQ